MDIISPLLILKTEVPDISAIQHVEIDIELANDEALLIQKVGFFLEYTLNWAVAQVAVITLAVDTAMPEPADQAAVATQMPDTRVLASFMHSHGAAGGACEQGQTWLFGNSEKQGYIQRHDMRVDAMGTTGAYPAIVVIDYYIVKLTQRELIEMVSRRR